MSCNCKHEKDNIQRDAETLETFRKYFVRRMTEDSDHFDKRRRDFNQSIFFFDDYEDEYSQVWSEMTMDMVLNCFDNAMKDFKKRYCDEHERNKFEKCVK